MAEFNIRSDAVDVEQIMAQIRTRVREKRGADYTEQEIRELAQVKLDRFLDPANVRSDLVGQYQARPSGPAAPGPASAGGASGSASTAEAAGGDPPPPRRRGGILRRAVRRLAEVFSNREAVRDLQTQVRARAELDALTYELLNNLVVEMTRLAIDMKNHRMRVESVAARLDFDERRARALETVVQYRKTIAPDDPGRDDQAGAPAPANDTGDPGSAPGAATRRRRRRGGRRRARGADDAGAAAAEPADAPAAPDAPDAPPAGAPGRARAARADGPRARGGHAPETRPGSRAAPRSPRRRRPDDTPGPTGAEPPDGPPDHTPPLRGDAPPDLQPGGAPEPRGPASAAAAAPADTGAEPPPAPAPASTGTSDDR